MSRLARARQMLLAALPEGLAAGVGIAWERASSVMAGPCAGEEIARALQQEERAIFDELERSLGVHLLLQSDPELHHERFDVVEV